MNTEKADIIQKIADKVRKQMEGAESAHDWWHVYRVWQNAKKIARCEPVDHFVVELAALLHDIADSKFFDGDENIGPRIAEELLIEYNLDPGIIEMILNVIRNISFRNSFENESLHSKELMVVQDADRLDAIGAIGVARAFNYGGYRNRVIYNPDLKAREFKSRDEYIKSDSPTINHFHEKLLLLKERMNTETGRKMAEDRHKFMEDFLKRFYGEWNCKM
jgi:uncharacterized protein